MAIFNIPTSQKQVIDRAATDVQLALPKTNPFFKNSFLGAIIYSYSGRIFDFYLQLNILITQLFVDTAEDEWLERWGFYRDINLNPATTSEGNVTATGTVGAIIPINTQLSDTLGNLFITTASVTVSAPAVLISSLTRSGTTVTAITASNHNFGSTQVVTISGASPSDYNGAQQITVTGLNSFTYQISTTPGSSSGTILASANMASLNVQSLAFGETQNLAEGTQLIFSSPVPGVNDNVIVQFSEVSGGTDLEDNPDYRVRVLNAYQNPISHFNQSDIISEAKKVPGVTRVFVYGSGDSYGDALSITSINRSGQVATVVTATAHGLENCMNVTVIGADQTDYNITARILVINSTTFCYIVANSPTSPATGTMTMQGSVPLGQVILFFTRDNDTNNIPTPGEIAAVQTQLYTIKPANTATNDFIIKAPTPVSVAFTFTGLVPNTPTMQAAITANLQALFAESTSVGTDLKSFSYTSAIYQTVDPETGDVVSDFTLSAPSGDVAIGAGQLPVLGGISF